MKPRSIKGRGATAHLPNRFAKQQLHQEHAEGIDEWEESECEQHTRVIEIYPKTILNKIKSPDVPGNWGMNPYQGCEHGCSYCYARNSHEYWGYNASLDFERVILFKRNAPQLLKKALHQKSWKGEPILLSGNTDCYQPLEKEKKITREVLKVMKQHRQAVGIITKNALVTRDIDILQEMAKLRIAQVSISINGVDEAIRSKLEPRTSTYRKRLEAIQKLSEAGIPVRALVAPIIPGINDHEIQRVAEQAAQAGAIDLGYTYIRLNGHLSALFEQWLQAYFPDRKKRVLSLIRQSHKGKLNDSTFGQRMKGDGPIANAIHQQIALAKKRYFDGKKMPDFQTDLFKRDHEQLSLF